MKIIKGVALVVIFMGLLITSVSLLMPSKVVANQTIIVNASPDSIMPYLNTPQNWSLWFPVLADTLRERKSKQVAIKNNTASWTENGKQRTLVLQKKGADYVQILLQTQGEKDIINMFVVSPVDAMSFQVEWKLMSELSWYPWEKFSGIFFSNLVEPACKQGLGKLKFLSEMN